MATVAQVAIPQTPPAPTPASPTKPIDFKKENIAARAFRARNKLSWFVRESWTVLEPIVRLEWDPFIEAICDHIQWILEDWRKAQKCVRKGLDPATVQRVRNACFSLPPGVLKTRIIMECAPAWMWLDSPSWSVTCLSVNPARSLESAIHMRDLVTSAWYQEWFAPAWRMREDQDAKGNFANTAGGFRKSAGITVQIIGGRTDAMFVDDPNDPEDDDEACIKVSKKWKTLWGRVNDARIAVRIIVQQRIAVDDLTGHIMKKPAGWMFFVLPLLFDPERICTTPFGWTDPRTVKDQPLHPQRFTPSVLAEYQETYAGSQFQAQCQQDPDKGDGETFKFAWWNWYRISNWKDRATTRCEGARLDDAKHILWDPVHNVLDVDSVVVTMDPTGGSEKDDASHVGLLVVGIKGEDRYVLDDLAPGVRGFYQQLDDLDVAVVRAWRLTGKRHIKVLVEKKALGEAILEAIAKHIREAKYKTDDGNSIAVSVEDWNPGSDKKEFRASAMEPTLVLGRIYLPEGAPWVVAFLKEFKRFPKKPNDRVDALAQLIARYGAKRTWKDAFV